MYLNTHIHSVLQCCQTALCLKKPELQPDVMFTESLVFSQVLPAPFLGLLFQMENESTKRKINVKKIILEWAENRSCVVHVCLLNTTTMLALC